MWTLECEGDSLAGKRIWLRPGKKYLFGRTKLPDARSSGFQINHKTVSRQHLTLSVSKVLHGDGSNVHAKSEVTLRDEDTKFRTEVDGASIKGECRTLKNETHTFKLGKSTQVFRLKWQPVVFTFSLTSKETKASKDPLAAYRSRLESLDVQVVVPYLIEATTHVVAGKRNTAKGLQALINGKYIVSEAFIDALIYAATPTDLDAEESLSPLEQDFDSNWPAAFEYLPVKSKEPSERPAEDFLPDTERGNVFEGYTFVFCDEVQYDTLQAPITNGGGKALHFAVEPGKTTTESIVRYVKSVAGEKGLGEFEDGSEGKGVVIVKFRGKGQHADWAAQLDYEVAQALDHRLIEQSEFLDAILAKDASMLRRPLLPNSDDLPANSGTAPRFEADLASVQASAPETKTTAAGRRNRAPIISRFKGFDDPDDETFLNDSLAPPLLAQSQANTGLGDGRSQHFSNRASFPDTDSMQDDIAYQPNGDSQKENPRKRPAPSSEVEDEEDLVDKLLPAATAMKRKRLEIEAEAERTGMSPHDSLENPQPKAIQAKKAKAVKEINVKDAVRERQRAEEEAARRDEESLQETLDGMTVEEMKSLAIVEEMDLAQCRPPAQRHNGQHDSRWDERWNGRKNFKRFRRRGDARQGRRGQSVIVPLEEVKKKDYGIGEDYWLEKESEGAKRRRKEKERRTQTQSQSQLTPYTTARSQALDVPSELIVDDGTNGGDTIDVDAPRMTRHQERTQQADDNSSSRLSASQVLTEKRGAKNQVPTLPMGPKKRKKFAAARESDDESESEDDEIQTTRAKRAR